MLEYCCSRNFLLGTLVFINCNSELLIKTLNRESAVKYFSKKTIECERKQTIYGLDPFPSKQHFQPLASPNSTTR